jgi:hypothetical protein
MVGRCRDALTGSEVDLDQVLASVAGDDAGDRPRPGPPGQRVRRHDQLGRSDRADGLGRPIGQQHRRVGAEAVAGIVEAPEHGPVANALNPVQQRHVDGAGDDGKEAVEDTLLGGQFTSGEVSAEDGMADVEGRAEPGQPGDEELERVGAVLLRRVDADVG